MRVSARQLAFLFMGRTGFLGHRIHRIFMRAARTDAVSEFRQKPIPTRFFGRGKQGDVLVLGAVVGSQ